MKAIGSLIKLAVIVAIAGFSMLNMDAVKLVYFPGKEAIELPLFIVLLAALVLGAVLATLLYVGDRLKLKSQIKTCKKQLKSAEADIAKLKNLPLTMKEEQAKPAEALKD